MEADFRNTISVPVKKRMKVGMGSNAVRPKRDPRPNNAAGIAPNKINPRTAIRRWNVFQRGEASAALSNIGIAMAK